MAPGKGLPVDHLPPRLLGHLHPPERLPGCAGAGYLLTVVQCFPEEAWANVNFHAAYLCDHDWQNFTISQISDTHIFWRNDTICGVLEPLFPGVRNRFVK